MPSNHPRRDLPDTITRIDIVGHEGGVQELWADHWTFSVQDQGETLKVFQHGSGADARSSRDQALAREVEKLNLARHYPEVEH